MASHQFATWRANIVGQIETALSGVTINDYPKTDDDDVDHNTATYTAEWIQLEAWRGARSEGSYGVADGRRHDLFDLPGLVAVGYASSFSESTDTGLQVAEARADTLLTGIDDGIETDPTLSATCLYAMVTDLEQTFGGDVNMRWVGWAFTVRVEAFTT